MAEIFITNFYRYNLPLLNIYWCAVSWIRFVLGNVRIGWGWNIHLISCLLCIIRLIWIGYGRRCISLFFIHPWSFNLSTQELRYYDSFFINTIFPTYIICLNYGTCTPISAWRKSKNVGACFTISLRNTNCERF